MTCGFGALAALAARAPNKSNNADRNTPRGPGCPGRAMLLAGVALSDDGARPRPKSWLRTQQAAMRPPNPHLR